MAVDVAPSSQLLLDADSTLHFSSIEFLATAVHCQWQSNSALRQGVMVFLPSFFNTLLQLASTEYLLFSTELFLQDSSSTATTTCLTTLLACCLLLATPVPLLCHLEITHSTLPPPKASLRIRHLS